MDGRHRRLRPAGLNPAYRPFSLALILGVLVGTYSSIYIASATALYLNITAQDLAPPQRDRKLIDDLP